MPGTGTLQVGLSHVSRHGLWLLAGQGELFMPFKHCSWFKAAAIEDLSAVERPTIDHLYWPLLDVDPSLESMRNPTSFPLVSSPNP